MQKTSIRFFEKIPVGAVWDDESNKWWYCAMDVAEALTKTTAPRKYWNTLKTRKIELSSICRQLKLKARDGKYYNTDVVDDSGLNSVIASVPSKKADVFARWMRDLETDLDEKRPAERGKNGFFAHGKIEVENFVRSQIEHTSSLTKTVEIVDYF